MARRNDLCTICGKDFAGPVLHDHLWKRIAEHNERMLCGFCMSDRMAQRLGRDLKIADSNRARSTCFITRIRGSPCSCETNGSRWPTLQSGRAAQPN
jgi:hypothetical protein